MATGDTDEVSFSNCLHAEKTSDSGYDESFLGEFESISQVIGEPPFNNSYGNFENFDKIDKTRVDQTALERKVSAISLESLTSGISSGGSSASEERLGTLQSVTSYSCLSRSFVGASEQRPSSSRDKIGLKGNLKKGSRGSVVSFHESTSDFSNSSKKCSKQARTCRCRSVPPCCVSDNGSSAQTDDVRHISFKNCDLESMKACKQKLVQRSDTKFDATLEKSQTFLHGQGKTFSRANEYLTPARPGLQKLQISYTQTNTENNHRKIFLDLVKSAHRQNMAIDESVRGLERRLFVRRTDPRRTTTFYEQQGIKDPIRSHKKKKPARTIAEKKKERKERIDKTSDEIKLGYVPTAQTMKIPGPEEILKIRKCRYLRIDPSLEIL